MIDRPTSIFAGYAGASGVYDEMAIASGNPRAHWSNFIASMERLGREEMAARWEQARRIIREHGVTYNVYGDPQGMDRPWELDMLPVMISSAEWAKLEAGLMQRTRLFNLILADLYGAAAFVEGRSFAAGTRLCEPAFSPSVPRAADQKPGAYPSSWSRFGALA